MKPTRQGKCSSCFIRFVWPVKKGHELKRAFCPHCGNKLEQTSHLLNYRIRYESPDFTPF